MKKKQVEMPSSYLVLKNKIDRRQGKLRRGLKNAFRRDETKKKEKKNDKSGQSNRGLKS